MWAKFNRYDQQLKLFVIIVKKCLFDKVNKSKLVHIKFQSNKNIYF